MHGLSGYQIVGIGFLTLSTLFVVYFVVKGVLYGRE